MKSSVSRRKFIAHSCAGVGLAASAPGAALAAADQSTGTKESAMPRRVFGKTGWMVSIVGFGAGSRFMAQENEDEIQRMIDGAIQLGINYFDTAFSYLKAGRRESYRRFGRYLVPKYRKDIILVSKFGERDADSAKASFETTLKELGTDRLDVLHFHALGNKADVDKIVAPNGALQAYRQWKDQGLIKAIGITGHASADVLLDAIERIEPDCMMCPLNPAHSGEFIGTNFAKVIPVALKRGMGMVAMKTTARTGLIGKNGVTAEQLVRYALNLPVATAVVGMPDLKVIESCAMLARTLQPLRDEERKELETKLASANSDASIPYLAAGYTDGHCPFA